jgi:hypothetical protein
MKCFVAMAFGSGDTDALFSSVIQPVLKAKNVEARRVDRIEHNDDIDDRIVAEIAAADFVLADLTYARPSVYYEAGFAERMLPVIYTVRKDHLNDAVDDPYRMWRVHFDLQMKNVIAWSSPDDGGFATRLAARIDTILAPLLAKLADSSRDQEAQARFARLPLNERKALLTDVFKSEMAERGFVSDAAARQNGEDCIFTGNSSHYGKMSDDVIQTVVCRFVSDDKVPTMYVNSSPDVNLNFSRALDRLSGIHVVEIACCFSLVPPDAVSRNLATFSRLARGQAWSHRGACDVPILDPSVGFVRHRLREVPNSLMSLIGLDDGEFLNGFEIERVPPGLSSRTNGASEGRFVHEGVRRRTVPLESTLVVIDDLTSEARFAARLQVELDELAALPLV